MTAAVAAAWPVDEPLVHRLATWARTRPDAPAYTFVDYLADPDGVARTVTWARVHQQAIGLAQRLARIVGPGERVAVLAPSGLEYVVALFAAWYARAVAVPLFAPDLPGHAERLAATYEDCAPRCVLTVPACGPQVREFVAARRHRAAVLVVEGDGEPDSGWRPAPANWDDIAYLQYSSGSTRVPAGVEITHRNLTANVAQLCATMTGGRREFTAVNWLPLFHDMGLLSMVAVPLWGGTDSVLFDPAAFLMRPVRWLRLLHGRSDAYTCAPNFAYDYCVRRLKAPELAGLDLSGVFVWLNGAEPVLPGTIERFTALLRGAGTGMDPRAMCAAYGLAEATVFVTGDRLDRVPTATRFDTHQLSAGAALPTAAATAGTTLVACGRAAGQQLVIADPETGMALPPGRVGEIWVHGPNVARRYWRQPERSAQVFGAVVHGLRPGNAPAGPWLRTGDLGVLHGGDLYVTGRMKDLLIVAGRNHYPQDIEATVAAASPAVGRVAAFTVPLDGQERVVVVAERARVERGAWRPGEIAREARRALWQRHDLALHDLVLAPTGSIPRTTSGKVSRTACRERYLAGDFAPATPPAGAGAVAVCVGAQPDAAAD